MGTLIRSELGVTLTFLLWPSTHLLSFCISSTPRKHPGSRPPSHSKHGGLSDQTWFQDLLEVARWFRSQLFWAGWLWSSYIIQAFFTILGNLIHEVVPQLRKMPEYERFYVFTSGTPNSTPLKHQFFYLCKWGALIHSLRSVSNSLVTVKWEKIFIWSPARSSGTSVPLSLIHSHSPSLCLGLQYTGHGRVSLISFLDHLLG